MYFTSFKGRNVLPGQRVKVYRNLHKPGVAYSIMDAKTRKVLGHASNLLLNSCKFEVSEAGRQRVLRTGRKNVHAFIEGSFGIIHYGDDEIFSDGVLVSYNPYTSDAFTRKDDGRRIFNCGLVYIRKECVFASGGVK